MQNAAVLSQAAFQELYDRLWHRALRGPQDRRGALNNARPDQLIAAAHGVSRGQAVSLAAQVEHEVSADNPNPWVHELPMPEECLASDGLDERERPNYQSTAWARASNDTAPSATQGIDFPVHVLAIRALGLPFLDYLALDGLTAACQAAACRAFLCVIAPLRLPIGTGSPVNPIAVF
jgi:hypothetical protein